MKRIAFATALAAFALAMLSCQISGTGSAPPGTGSSLAQKSVKLYDGNGVFLGYVTRSDSGGLGIYTTAGYFVDLNWDGTLSDTTGYYTGTNGSGTLFVSTAGSSMYGGFVVSIGGQLYVPAAVDSNGTATQDTAITGYQSYYAPNSGSVVNSSGTLATGTAAVPLRVATATEAGLPATPPFSLPLQLHFD